MSHDPHPWATDLAALRAQLWSRLGRGVRDRRSPARHPTLATVSPAGMPEARTVVLRAADPVRAQIEIHTDLASAKVAAIRTTPWAQLHVWDSPARLQIRLTARAAILSGPETEQRWRTLPDTARRTYGPVPEPGTPVAGSQAFETRSDPSSFAVLRLGLEQMEALHLGPQHRRARFRRDRGWEGEWLVP